MKRLCKRCKTSKCLSDFFKNKNKYLGRAHTCKVCATEVIRDFGRTKKGLACAIFNGQKSCARYRGMQLPNYSKKELEDWLFSQPTFNSIYEKWVGGHYLKDLKPSIDRIDDYKSYTIDNIQLMTWRGNREKVCKDKINGVNNKQNKAVVATIKGTDKTTMYYSVAEAARALKISGKNIIYCCKNKPRYKSAGGYTWQYA